MNRSVILFGLICTISTSALKAKTFHYEYLYTINRDGMKSFNGCCDNNFNKYASPLLVIFSEDYSLITFGTEELQPYVWRLAYSNERNGVFYYDNLIVAGLNPGYPTDYYTSIIAGRAAGEMSVFEISCNQPKSNIQFSVPKGFPPVQTDFIPKSPLTILVKSDLTKINIVFHKSGDTIVLRKKTTTNKQNKTPMLIE